MAAPVSRTCSKAFLFIKAHAESHNGAMPLHRDIAAHLGIRRTSVTAIICELAEAGLLTQRRGDKTRYTIAEGAKVPVAKDMLERLDRYCANIHATRGDVVRVALDTFLASKGYFRQ